MHIVGEGPGETTSSLRGFPYLINSLLSDKKKKKKKTPCQKLGVFLTPSDVYVRHYLYLFHILIKFCYTKNSKWSSLVYSPRLKSSPPEVTNPSVAHGLQQQPFSSIFRLLFILFGDLKFSDFR